MNARFWQWHNNGWVKLTLKPGQRLEAIALGGLTDEGSSWEENAWEFDGETVFSEYHTDGSDCDGRHEYYAKVFCSVSDLRAVDQYGEFPEKENEGIFRPEWERVGSHQRDYAAEAAGY